MLAAADRCRLFELQYTAIRVDDNADGRCIGSQLAQEPEPLRLQLGLKPAKSGEIAAGSMQVGNQPAADRIRSRSAKTTVRWRSRPWLQRSNIAADGNNDRNLAADEIRPANYGHTIVISLAQ